MLQWVNRNTLINLQKWLNRHDPGPLIFFKSLDVSNFMSLVHGLVEWIPLNTTIPVLAVYRVPVSQQEHFNKPSKMAQSPWPRTFDFFQKFGRFTLHEFGPWTCRVGEHNDTSAGSVAWVNRNTLINLQKWLNRHDPRTFDFFQKFGRFTLHEFGPWTCRVGRREHNDTSAGSVACSSESTGTL